MKKQILFLTVLSFGFLNSYSQIIFEKGYFIDESDQKIDCLIKNIDWLNNPREFQYKLTESSEVSTATVQTIKEFRVDGASKYVRAKVKIDRSPSDLSNLTTERNPIFTEELLFLKVVVEGQATLYSFEDGKLFRFFYKTPNKEINQLVYKMYRRDDEIISNYSYKQELFQNLTCHGLDQADFERLDYYDRDLERLFIKYNKCIDPNFIANTTIKTKTKKSSLNLTVRPGVSVISLTLENPLSDYLNTEMEKNLGFRLGLEVEYVLSFNKNKWALLIEPTYQYFSAEQSTDTNNPSYGVIGTSVNYQSIELPVGIRYYIFLNKDSKIFVNAFGVFDYSFNSTIKFKKGNGSDLHNPLEVNSRLNPAIGLGYKLKNKYGIEIRYQINRNILSNYAVWGSSYNAATIILGYSF